MIRPLIHTSAKEVFASEVAVPFSIHPLNSVSAAEVNHLRLGAVTVDGGLWYKGMRSFVKWTVAQDWCQSPMASS